MADRQGPSRRRPNDSRPPVRLPATLETAAAGPPLTVVGRVAWVDRAFQAGNGAAGVAFVDALDRVLVRGVSAVERPPGEPSGASVENEPEHRCQGCPFAHAATTPALAAQSDHTAAAPLTALASDRIPQALPGPQGTLSVLLHFLKP